MREFNSRWVRWALTFETPLVKPLLQPARTQASTVTLRVYRDNAVAIALYTSLGFSEQEEESTQELLFMRL